MEVGPGGGSDRPDQDPDAQTVLFVVEGQIVGHPGRPKSTRMGPGDYAYIPAWPANGPCAMTAPSPGPLSLDSQGL